MLEDCAPGMSNVRVVAIIGVPGIGKTTLAQSIFNHPRAGEIFDIKVWIYVPEVFDIFQIVTSILDLSPKPSGPVETYDSVTNLGADEHTKDLDGADEHTKDLDFIQKRLNKVIARKRFLIVLDDVWDQNFNAKSQWDTLCLSLQSAAAGSTIIVTTHSKDIAIRFHPILTVELPKLSHDDCWTLIKERVFADSHAILDRSLEEVGWRIAAKCNGLPLAAKAVGGLLENASDAREWENIENNRIWDSSPGRKEILPALFLSYKFLPPHLRRCFAYCSIFPKNYQFQKDKLLSLWMAEVKGDCFDDLFARSFFQESSSNEHYFTMHYLIRELAVHVMGEFGFALEANASCVVPVRPRHFTYKQCEYETADRFGCIVGSVTSQTLRTFLSTGSSSKEPLYYLSIKTLVSLGQSFGRLRVLSLCGYGISSVPPFIERLTLLRYLDLSSTLIDGFPETLCRLCNLQTLLLSDCHRLELLPSKFGDLIQLHHLDIRGTTMLKEMPKGIGKLSSLQMLSDFMVGNNRGAGIGELGGLEHLKGHLRVSGLGNVVSEEDAKAAKLFEKMHLDGLHLLLDGNLGNKQYKKVLEGLMPPSDLRRLAIFNYRGKTFPNWVGDAAFHELENLHLKGCSNCINLPPVGQLPLLKYLTIEGFSRVTTVGLEFYGEHQSAAVRSFPFLKILKFKRISHWTTWFTPEADASLFPRLEEIHIEDCEYLRQSLPLDLPCLKVLIVRNCESFSGSLPRSPLLSELTVEFSLKMDLRSLPEFTCLTSLSLCGTVHGENQAVSNSVATVATVKAALPRLTSLQSLELGYHSLFQSVRYDEFAQEPLCIPSSVRSISISGVNGIERALNSFALQHLLIYNSNDPSLHFPASNYQMLNYLKIECFHHLEEFHIIPEEAKLGLTSLRELFIMNCPGLSIFPAGGLWAFNLTTLHIVDCRGLKSLSSALPECFPSLRHLFITSCDLLKSFAENSLPRHLQTLCISRCGSLESLPQSISRCAALQQLDIDSCRRFKWLPDRGFPPNLCKLKISSCASLTYLPNLCTLTCLEVLHISNCHLIASFLAGGLPPNLEILCYKGCNASDYVDWQLDRLIFLKRLEIEWTFENVHSFPADGSLPCGLTHLGICSSDQMPLFNFVVGPGDPSFRSLNCRELRRIKCLQQLEIRGCFWLKTFSGELPQSLCRLVIEDYPLPRDR